MSWFENPGAYNEAQKHIREQKESENTIVEKKREDFEIGKEKLYTKKKLDVFELKRRIETGHSLSRLKGEIKEAYDQGEISIETYTSAIDAMRHRETWEMVDMSDYTIDSSTLPLSHNPLAQFLEKQKLGENIFIDIGGALYGFVQGSVFLLFLLGRIVLDALLLPKDIYQSIKK